MKNMNRFKKIYIREVKDKRYVPDPEKLYSSVNGESLEWLLRYSNSLDKVFSKEDRLFLADLIYWYKFFCHVYMTSLEASKTIDKKN